MIWQTMMGMGEGKDPKQCWDNHDEQYQHFSCRTGSRNINRINKGDRLVIYWPGPGRRIYMGISRAAESSHVLPFHAALPAFPQGLLRCGSGYAVIKQLSKSSFGCASATPNVP